MYAIIYFKCLWLTVRQLHFNTAVKNYTKGGKNRSEARGTLWNGLGLWLSSTSGLPTCLVLILGFPRALILPRLDSILSFISCCCSSSSSLRSWNLERIPGLMLLSLRRCYFLVCHLSFPKVRHFPEQQLLLPLCTLYRVIESLPHRLSPSTASL